MKARSTSAYLVSLVLPVVAAVAFVAAAPRAAGGTNCTHDGQDYSEGACIRNFTFVCQDTESICMCQGNGSWFAA
jgi:hypothetical protein